MAKRYKVGYTQGVFDMFHIGHLNLINRAKEQCETLVVGVNSDALVREYKHKTPVIREDERREIVANIRAVDECVVVSTLDKVDAWERFRFDAIFIGDDWKGNARWAETEARLAPLGARVVYLPYTRQISSTSLKRETDRRVDDSEASDGNGAPRP